MRIGLNSPQALLALVIRRRWWIIMPFVALTCMVAVLAKSLPKSFISESLILVQPRDVPANFVVDLISGTTTDRVKSIETTVMSRTNLLQIIREFGGNMPEMKNLNMDEKVEKLRGQISIKYPMNPLRPNQQLPITYFRINYSNQSPELAQQITQKLTLLFIAQDNQNRENQVDGTKDFLASELAKLTDDLRVADDRVKQMRAAHLGELPERLETNQRMLESLTQQARGVEDQLFANSNQKLQYEQLLAETLPTIPAKTLQAAGPNNNNNAAAKAPAEDQKILDYRKANLAYEDAASKNGAQHPNVLSAKAVRDKAAKGLSPEELEIARKPPVTATAALPPAVPGTPAPAAADEPNPIYQKIRESLQANENEHARLLSSKADYAKRMAQYAARIENTPQVETEMADVLRERDSLQKQHDDIKGKFHQAELSASLENQSKGQQFTIQDAANRPVDPATPKKSIIVLGGSAASLFLSLIFAVVVDIARQRIWTQKEIETFWGVPVLVDIPEILTDTDLAAARRRKLVFAASAVGAAMVYSVCLYGVHLKHAFILRHLDPVLSKLIN